jgi:alpha-ketoglutarate-dependent taurine dioxygenase/4-hydroxybenzoate polyprenyltransferase
MTIISEELMRPFGLVVTFAPGTPWEAVDAAWLAARAEEARVVVLRGLAPPDRLAFCLGARRLGPLLAWPFGAVNELKVVDDTPNYLYTDRAVPLHWDGAFVGTPPRFLVFRCLVAPPPGAGGETLFVDTTRVWDRAPPEVRRRWRFWRFRYSTEARAHYGGTFEAPLVDHHPRTGQVVLRFAEPVDDKNPVRVDPIGLSPPEAAAALGELEEALHDPAVSLALAWRADDIVVADNLTLLHGRHPFVGSRARHLWRVNVLLPDRARHAWWWDSLRIRRPEFLVAEVPIAILPALLLAAPGALWTWQWAEVLALLVLLFHFGDMINCHADRALDLPYKTRTAEAVFGLGEDVVRAQIAVTAVVALALAADLSLRSGPAWVLPGTALGLLLGAAYSVAPVRLKARGLLQLPTLWALIFAGPMLLASAPFVEVPPVWFLAFVAAYGVMQQGTVLVNTAEDLREDRAAGLRTSAVALGPRGSLRVAAVAIALGGVVVAVFFGRHVPLVGLLPLVGGVGWAVVALAHALVSGRGRDPEETARRVARWMPAWITATAWGTLLAAAWGRYRGAEWGF